MHTEEKKCVECDKPLKPSQFARRMFPGQPITKANDDLVCRNYPDCPRAEVEPTK